MRWRSLGLRGLPSGPFVVSGVLTALFLLSFMGVVSAPPSGSPMDEDSGSLAADLILQNGKILTFGDSDRTVEAVAIRNNRFVAVGTASAMQEFAAESTRIVDLAMLLHQFSTNLSPILPRSVAGCTSRTEQSVGHAGHSRGDNHQLVMARMVGDDLRHTLHSLGAAN